MAYLLAVVSTLVAGLVFAVVARALGVEHHGVLFAIAICGFALQGVFLILWYLLRAQPREPIQVDMAGGRARAGE